MKEVFIRANKDTGVIHLARLINNCQHTEHFYFLTRCGIKLYGPRKIGLRKKFSQRLCFRCENRRLEGEEK